GADDETTVPGEVIDPAISPRVEQRDGRPCQRIDRDQAVRLGQVTGGAGPGEGAGGISAARGGRGGGLVVEGSPLEGLVRAAVFAAPGGAGLALPQHLGAAGGHTGCRPSRRRAWARSRDIVWLSSTSAARSSRSVSLSVPSVLRSMRTWRRASVRGGKRSSAR